jgi:putative membrane protein
VDGTGDALACCIGFALGFAGGLLPGLHPNTVISALSSIGLDGRTLGLVIIVLLPAHTVSSYIPSVFFGVPEAGTVVAALPGQRMVQRGEGVRALRTILLSCAVSAIISCALFGPAVIAYPVAYSLIRPHMRFVLLGIAALLLLRTKSPWLSAAIFILSGILGHASFGSGMGDPFLPLFSGMFAMSGFAAWKRGAVPRQEDAPADARTAWFSAAGILPGFAAGLVPGVGSPSQMAVFAAMAVRMDTAAYLAVISSIAVSQAVFSLATSAAIGKSRVGATAVLAESMDVAAALPALLSLFLASLALAACLAYALRMHAAKLASLDFSRLRLVLAAYLAAITLIIDGPAGLVVLAASTGIGLLCLLLDCERTNMMGAIILPTLMLLFGFPA